MSIAYLAEPIDQRSDLTGTEFHAVWVRLELLGLDVYRPFKAWRTGSTNPDPRIEQVNRRALELADLLVAVLPAGVPSIGVPMEIAAASHRGIPAVVLSDVYSQALAGAPGVDQIRHLNQLDEAVQVALAAAPATPEPEPIRVKLWYSSRELVSHRRAYSDDAGIDLVTVGDRVIPPGTYTAVPTTIAGVQLPAGTWAMITGRSSTMRDRSLHVPVSVIDPGWRGPLLVGAWNLGAESIKVADGDRIGQLILFENHTERHTVQVVETLDPHERGTSGFGSSGQ